MLLLVDAVRGASLCTKDLKTYPDVTWLHQAFVEELQYLYIHTPQQVVSYVKYARSQSLKIPYAVEFTVFDFIPVSKQIVNNFSS